MDGKMSMTKYRRTRKLRTESGVAPLEIAISAGLMIVVTGLAADVTLLLFAMSTNDSACRDACRAAGGQSTSAAALNAATSMLKIHATDGFFITQPTLVSSASPYFVYQDYSGTPPSNMSPYVTVSSQITARMPCPLIFFGTKFNNGSSFTFKRSYTFPIVKSKLTGG